MYCNLVYATPGPERATSPYFKDSSFGVPADDVERRYSPRGDVTIVRDKGFGVPHVYGRDRDGAMFGLGYAAAEDRLFFMDALRNAGRGQLSSFAGGANARPGRASSGRSRRTPRPTSSARPSRRRASRPTSRRRSPPTPTTTSPASTATSPRPSSTRPRCRASTRRSGARRARSRGSAPTSSRRRRWSAASSARAAARRSPGPRSSMRSTRASRSARRASSATSAPPRTRRRRRRCSGGEALPLPGAAAKGRAGQPRDLPPRLAAAAGRRVALGRGELRAGRKGLLDGLLAFPNAASNAMLVSARESASGKPLMVAGPQVAYFNPQILMEQDVHAPAAPASPGSTPAAPRSSGSTSTSSSGAGATTRGARRRRART